jgi:hypothetical protein
MKKRKASATRNQGGVDHDFADQRRGRCSQCVVVEILADRRRGAGRRGQATRFQFGLSRSRCTYGDARLRGSGLSWVG